MADGPLFCMWPPPDSDDAATRTGGAAAATTFAEHAKRFSETCDGFRAVCEGARAGSDSETLRTQGELLVLELKRSARDLHDSLRHGVESTDQARNNVDGVAVRVRLSPRAAHAAPLPAVLKSLAVRAMFGGAAARAGVREGPP